MLRTKRFQNRITTGRFTLPTAILITTLCWLLTSLLQSASPAIQSPYALEQVIGMHINLAPWVDSLCSFILYGFIGYLLVELNNTFAIIRIRASVQTAIYFLLIAICPPLHTLSAGLIASLAFLLSVMFLFRSYQRSEAMNDLFHTFLFLGIGSLFLPHLILFAPLFWIGAYNFQSLQPRSFFASLVGISVPYWFLFGHCYFYQQMERFYLPFQALCTFDTIGLHFGTCEWLTIGYLFLLYVVSAIHCMVAGYEDKIRTRSYLSFLILLSFCLFLYILLQSSAALHFMPLLIIGISILAAHFFVLTNSRGTNLFFITSLLTLGMILTYNLWTL